MDPVIGALVTLVRSLGVPALRAAVRRPLTRLRVAWRVRQLAKKAAIRVTFVALFRWLARSDVQQQLVSEDPLAIETAVRNLAWRIEGRSLEHATLLARWVLESFLLSGTPQMAALVTASRTQHEIVEGNERIESELKGLGFAILERPAQFERDLSLLHPSLRAKTRDLAERWPAAVDLSHSLATATERSELLSSWASQPPIQMADAPTEGWLWLGELATEYGARRAAVEFISRGIAHGAADADYWWVRAALAIGPQSDLTEMRALLAKAPSHPLGIAVACLLDGDPDGTEAALAQWDPPSLQDRVIRASFLSAAATGRQQANRAIAILEDAAVLDKNASGIRVLVAQLLLARARLGVSDSIVSDYAKARGYALAARDLRRIWDGDSVEAILVALKATALAGDLEGAQRLITPVPLGDATPHESKDPRLIGERAKLAALTGDNQTAMTLMEQLNLEHDRHLVLGYIAQRQGDTNEASTQMLNAWRSAESDDERIEAAAALAELGASMPDLADLESRQPEVVARIKTLHDVTTKPGDRLVNLRQKAHDSEQISVVLAETLAGVDDMLGAAAVLRDAGLRWNNPLLLKMAADRHQAGGDFQAAVECCQEALQLAGSGWAGEVDALGVMFNAQESLGLHDQSLLTAKRMVSIAPESLDVRWVLIQSLLRHGDLPGAWSALNYNGEPVQPRSPHEVRACVDLLARFDMSPLFLSRALKLFNEWESDEELQGVILAQVHLRSGSRKLSDGDVEILQRATATYLGEHPNSAVFRSFSVTDDQDPLANIQEELKRRAPDPELVALVQRIRTGEIPLGLGALAMGRSYAECAILGISDLVYSSAPAFSEGSQTAAQTAIGNSAVLDPSAAVTLARISETTRETLTASFQFVDGTVEAYRDALQAQESLALRSTMSLGWNQEAARPSVSRITQTEADALAALADGVVSVYGRARRSSWPHLKHLSEFEDAEPWLGSLDYAIETGTPFWCDDVVLRSIARDRGVSSFSTVDLMRELVHEGALGSSEERMAEAVLIDGRYVELGFESETMRLAADLGGWQPRGAAAVLVRAANWADPETVIAFVLEGVARNIAADPESVRGWTYYATKGVVAIAADNRAAAQRNVRLLVERLLSTVSMHRHAVPFVLAGVRDALGEEPGLQDPLEDVLRQLHSGLVSKYGHPGAAQLLLALVEHTGEKDRDLAARVILTTPK